MNSAFRNKALRHKQGIGKREKIFATMAVGSPALQNSQPLLFYRYTYFWITSTFFIKFALYFFVIENPLSSTTADQHYRFTIFHSKSASDGTSAPPVSVVPFMSQIVL
jgi:hypothetical protein